MLVESLCIPYILYIRNYIYYIVMHRYSGLTLRTLQVYIIHIKTGKKHSSFVTTRLFFFSSVVIFVITTRFKLFYKESRKKIIKKIKGSENGFNCSKTTHTYNIRTYHNIYIHNVHTYIYINIHTMYHVIYTYIPTIKVSLYLPTPLVQRI